MKLEHLLTGAALLLVVTAGCRDASRPEAASGLDPEAVVARWKGGEIRRGAIREALYRRLAAVPKPIAPETRKAIVRQVVERRVRGEMLWEEARATGFADRPEVLQRQAAAEEAVLAEDLLARETATVTATEPQVIAEVERRLAGGTREEARKFSHIFLRAPESDKAARAAAAVRMESIRQELGGGASFEELAERYSTSVTARGGGRVDWTLRRSLNPAAAEAIFALAEGEVSAAVATPDGLHLFRLDGIRPATPLDAERIRRDVRQELDAEARRAAAQARRQRELDEHGAEMPPRAAARRQEEENRLLAASRRAQGLTPELAARVAAARRQAVIEAYREMLSGGFATAPTEEEIVRYHRDHAERALFLRDFQIDALFFPQTGDSVADVYAAGESVGAALREGVAFDELLRHPVRPEARLCREAHGVDLTALGNTSIRLRKALLSLSPGKVSPAIYLDGPRTELVPPTCVFEGRGVVFVRLRGLGTLPLERTREAIRAALEKEKMAAAIEGLQRRLIDASGLEILLPEG